MSYKSDQKNLINQNYTDHKINFSSVYSIAVESEQGLSNLKGLSKPFYKNVRRGLLNYFNKYLDTPAPIPPKSKPQCTICFLYTDEHTTETCPSQPRCFNW